MQVYDEDEDLQEEFFKELNKKMKRAFFWAGIIITVLFVLIMWHILSNDTL
jgi:hypothetical protein